MFRHPAWAVGSYSSGPPAAGNVGNKPMGGFYQADGSPCTIYVKAQYLITAFSSEMRTFGQRGRQGPAVRFGQNVRQWLEDGVL